MQQKRFTFFVIALALVALLGSLMLVPAPRVDAAPNAVLTPVSYSGSGMDNQKVIFFNGNITADARVCVDLSNYQKIDLQYVIDQGTTNTTTLKLQWSNDYNATTATGNFEDQSTIVSANAADAHGGQQYALVGQWNCVFADVTNSNALGLRVIGVAKP